MQETLDMYDLMITSYRFACEKLCVLVSPRKSWRTYVVLYDSEGQGREKSIRKLISFPRIGARQAEGEVAPYEVGSRSLL